MKFISQIPIPTTPYCLYIHVFYSITEITHYIRIIKNILFPALKNTILGGIHHPQICGPNLIIIMLLTNSLFNPFLSNYDIFNGFIRLSIS